MTDMKIGARTNQETKVEADRFNPRESTKRLEMEKNGDKGKKLPKKSKWASVKNSMKFVNVCKEETSKNKEHQEALDYYKNNPLHQEASKKMELENAARPGTGSDFGSRSDFLEFCSQFNNLDSPDDTELLEASQSTRGTKSPKPFARMTREQLDMEQLCNIEIVIQTPEKRSKWKLLKNVITSINKSKSKVEEPEEPPPSIISQLYPQQHKGRSQSLVDEQIRKEIYQICGDEINLYLNGVDYRLPERSPSHSESPVLSGGPYTGESTPASSSPAKPKLKGLLQDSQNVRSKWKLLGNTMMFINNTKAKKEEAKAEAADTLCDMARVDPEGDVVSQELQKEICEIWGDEINLYLRGVNRRFSHT